MKEQLNTEESCTITCEFCLVPQTNGTQTFKNLYGIDQQITTIDTKNDFFVLQDIVPLGVNGLHLLVIPKTVIGQRHAISLALVSQKESFPLVNKAVINKLISMNPHLEICAFEHGAGYIDEEPVACGGCHMDHAHGHYVTLPHESSFEEIVDTTENLLKKAGWEDIGKNRIEHETLFPSDLQTYTGVYPYIHLGVNDRNGKEHAFTYIQNNPSLQVESQLLRRAIASTCYGQEDSSFYHWRDIVAGFTSQDRMKQLQDNVRLSRYLL